jgi:beta-galactosidase
VQDWRADPSPPRSIAVYSNAPQVELFLNGRSLGRCHMSFADYCQWNMSASFVPGNLSAVALSVEGVVLASDTR